MNNFKNKLLLMGALSFIASQAMASPAVKNRNPKNPNIRNTDLAVVGPGEEMMVYYKSEDGRSVVVRRCDLGEDNYAGLAKVNDRSDCKTMGPENKVPVDAFKRTLKNGFMILDSDKLKPLTPKEIAEYRASDSDEPNQIAENKKKELEDKFESIKAVIEKFGADTKSKADLEAVEKLLGTAKAKLEAGKPAGEAAKKINALINEIVDKQIGDKKFNWVSAGKHEDQAVYSLLKQYDGTIPECGTDEILNGGKRGSGGSVPGTKGTWLENLFEVSAMADESADSLAAKIRDCKKIVSPKTTKAGVVWNLVSRKRDSKTGKFYETWQDSQTGLLWGDALEKRYTHDNFYTQSGYGHAVRLDKKEDGKIVEEVACESEDGKIASAGVKEKKFALATIEEYEKAENNGIREVLPNMSGRFFWCASLYPKSKVYARGFVGDNGDTGVGYRDVDDSVRCVGR